MGGTKKKSISQMLKAQLAQQERERRRVQEAKSEKKIAGIEGPDVESREFIEEVKSMKVVTPYLLASKYNLRLSVAKDYLEILESKGILRRVGGHNRIRIFQAAA